jgi:ribose transport system permease protein
MVAMTATQESAMSPPSVTSDVALEAAPAITAPIRRQPRGGLGQFVERYAILIAWAAVIVVFWIWRPDTFGTLSNFKGIFGSQSSLLVLTLGLLVVLAAGEFDLSIGSTFSMGASGLAFLDVEKKWPILVSVVFLVALGVVVGAINGLISIRFGVPSIVATLGMSTLLAGLILGVCGPKIRSGLDSGYVNLIRGKWIGLPRSFWFALLLTTLLWYIFQHTPLGRYVLFVGRGREVARLAGIRVDRVRWGSLIASSTLATVAGMVLAGTSASAQAGVGNGYLLPAFAAAFLGATAIIPGQFNAWGSWASVYFLLTGITGLSLVGYSGWPEQVFYGGALILAVVLSQFATRARARSASAA